MPLQLNLFSEATLDTEFRSIMRMIPASESDYATHNLHPYPGKFLPHYPRIFIQYYSREGDLVIDPMCGSGTTLIEACLLNRRAYGTDIDPVAALVARVSITPLSYETLVQYERTLMGILSSRMTSRDAEKVELPSDEDFPNITLWFREDNLRDLLLVRNSILELPTTGPLRDFGLLCLSSIVRTVSNADPRDIFPERDREKPVRDRVDVLSTFKRAFHDNASRVTDFSRQVHGETRGTATQGDARSIDLPPCSAHLVFSSPPYAYAMDYARVHQLSTLLFVLNNDGFRAHRPKYIGTDRISVAEPLGSFEGFEFARDEIQSVYEDNRKLGLILYKYFADMHLVTLECKRILKPEGHLIYVVGNSTVRGTHFHTTEVITRICKGLGFNIAEQLQRPYYAYRMSRKRNAQSNTIKADVFIVAEKLNDR